MADTTSTSKTYVPGKQTSTTVNWMRKYRIKIYQHTKSTSNTGDSKTYYQDFTAEKDTDTVLDVSNLRVVFSVKRNAQYYPNQAVVTIYNLNAKTENSIIQEGYRIIIEAGYPSNYGQIFDGTVLMCNRYKQNATDYILNILAIDGNQFINEGYCTFTFAKGQTARQIVKGICDKATNPISLGYASPALDNYIFSKGMAVNGQTKATLSDIARTINGTWYVDKGKLYMIAYADSADNLPGGRSQAVELSPKTGLLGNPQQVNYGIDAKCLLNPKLMPYGLVHIASEYITEQMVQVGSFAQGISTPYKLDPEGIYRICSVSFVGDTRGNDWYSEVVAVGQVGDMASMLTSSSYTGN